MASGWSEEQGIAGFYREEEGGQLGLGFRAVALLFFISIPLPLGSAPAAGGHGSLSCDVSSNRAHFFPCFLNHSSSSGRTGTSGFSNSGDSCLLHFSPIRLPFCATRVLYEGLCFQWEIRCLVLVFTGAGFDVSRVGRRQSRCGECCEAACIVRELLHVF